VTMVAAAPPKRIMASKPRLDVLTRHLTSEPMGVDIEDLVRRSWPDDPTLVAAAAVGGCGSSGSSGFSGCGCSSSSAAAPKASFPPGYRGVMAPSSCSATPVTPSSCSAAAVTSQESHSSYFDDLITSEFPVADAKKPAMRQASREPKIKTAEDYFQSLRGRNMVVYLFGELLPEPVDHPIVWPSVNAVAETYRLGEQRPELGTAVGPGGVRASRFLHIAESAADLVLQSQMQRELGRRTGTCFQRCVGMDAINSTFSTTYDIDQKFGTNYHERFYRFVREMQANNYVVGGAMTDAKGDRSKSPANQDDPDLFVRVSERKPDGSVLLRGCKMHQTGTINSHWMIVMPGGSMTEVDKDYAILCAVPVDVLGLTYVYGRQSCDLRAMEGGDIDQGNAQFGGQETTIIFEDVHVPAEYIFMNGEVDFCITLVERFTAYHRRSYICKAGLGDVMLGAAATISEYQGTIKASHVKDKLIEMSYLNENIAGTAMAASHGGKATASGNFLPDVLMANVCKHNVTRFPYEIARLTQDLAGGLMVTLPSDKDFQHKVIGPMLDKYLATKQGVTAENRRRILRLIENLTMGRNAVGYLTESMHGAGSPQAQRVMIQRLVDMDRNKRLAKSLAGINE